MALAAEDFEELIGAMGLAGTAAASLDGLLASLTAQTEAAAAAARANAAAEKLAASTGSSAADIKKALAAANAAAAAEEKRLASEQIAAAKAAETAATAAAKEAAAKEAAAEKAATAAAKLAEKAAADQAARDREMMQENLRMMAVRDQRAAAEKSAGEAAAAALAKEGAAASETRKWFEDLTASGSEQEATMDRLSGLWEAYGPILEASWSVIKRVATGLWDLAKTAIEATQEKDAVRAMLGADALDMLDELASVMPYTTDQLAAWGKGLKIAGLEGERLKTAVQAVGASAAIMRDGGAAAEALIKRLKMTADAGGKVSLDRRMLSQIAAAGLGVDDLARAMGVTVEQLKKMTLSADQLGDAVQKALITKGAGPLALLGQRWSTISAKINEGIEDAFEDLGDLVNPFMTEVQLLASEFFKGSAASGGFAAIIRGILTPAFEIATSAVRAVHYAFLYAQIAILTVLIPLQKIGATAFAASWGLFALKWIGVGLLVILGAIAVAAGLVAIPFLLAGAAIFFVVFGIAKLVGVVAGAIANLDNIGAAASSAGANIVNGLVGSIRSGAGIFAQAMKDMAASGLNAFTSFFGIASPSKVMKKHARDNIAIGGVAGGLDEGADEVDRAMTDLVPMPSAKGGKRGKRDAGGRTSALTFNNCTFGGDLTEGRMREWLDRYMEEMSAAGPEPEPA